MSLKECYEKMGADYEDVLSRLRSEGLVRKFAVKFLDDDSYAALKDAMAAGKDVYKRQVEEDTPARAATSFIVTAMIKPPGFSKNRMVSF